MGYQNEDLHPNRHFDQHGYLEASFDRNDNQRIGSLSISRWDNLCGRNTGHWMFSNLLNQRRVITFNLQ